MADESRNLWQRISAVMNDIRYLAKDDRVKFGTTDYKAISEEKVTSTVRESLVRNGLVIVPVEQEHTKDGILTTVNVRYKIVNIDKPEEYEIIMSSGTGADTQDKGVGKAMTYAYKYLLLRTFAIPTGEDPDKISSEELDVTQKKAEGEERKADREDEEQDPNLITQAQAKKLFAMAGKGNEKIVKDIILKYNYYRTDQIKTADYEAILKEIDEAAKTRNSNKTKIPALPLDVPHIYYGIQEKNKQ